MTKSVAETVALAHLRHAIDATSNTDRPHDVVRLAAIAVVNVFTLSNGDIDTIIEGLEHFCIGPQYSDELEGIWRPYIDKLKRLKT